ncbi:MAG: ATP-binding protein [Spirochaetia bacterium]
MSILKRMRKDNSLKYSTFLTIAGSAAAFIFVSLISVFVFLIYLNQVRVITLYKVQQQSIFALEAGRESIRPDRSYRNRPSPMPENLEAEDVWNIIAETVSGLGFYGPEGEPVFFQGTAPESFPDTELEIDHEKIIFNEEEQSLTILRESGLFSSPRFRGRIPEVTGYPVIRYIYVDVPAKGYWGKKRKAFIFLITSILLSLLFFSLLGYSLIRNARYKRALQKQEELVVLGMAARTLAHEIKNPLSAIRLQTTLLRKQLPAPAKQELSIIDEETQRLKELADRVSNYLKDPLGRTEQIDIAPYLEEIVQRFETDIPVYYKNSGPFFINFDKQRFRSVIENLIKNALESSETPEVLVTVHQEKQEVKIKIHDNGPGISDDNSMVFHPFYTTKEHGSGVGLAISKRFIEAAGGSLQLVPREEGGTTAQMVVPKS